jgi:hypothetical protein
MRIQIFIWGGSVCTVDPDPPFLFDGEADPASDPTFHPDTSSDPNPTFHPDGNPDPDPDPSFQIKAQTLEKVLK